MLRVKSNIHSFDDKTPLVSVRIKRTCSEAIFKSIRLSAHEHHTADIYVRIL